MFNEQTAHILKLAMRFEQQNNLLKFAKIEIDYTLESNLSRIINKSIPSKNLQKWVEKNLSFLKDFVVNRSMVLPSGILRFSTTSKHNNKPVWAIISTDPKLVDNYDIISSSLLSGEGVIPNLWLYLGTFSDESMGLIVSYELAHDDFILISLSSMFYEVGDKLIRNAEAFYKNNKSKIESLKKMFKTRPKLLGRGDDGVAFSIGPNLVLKIFKDNFSYLKAQEAMQRLHKMPELAKTEAMIYDIGTLGEYRGYPIYYYIMEKMTPVRSLDIDILYNVRVITGAIGDYIYMRSKEGKLLSIKNNIEKYMATKSTREELLQSLKEMNRFAERFIKMKYGDVISQINESLKDKLNPNWLQLLIEEITIKYLTGRGDLHAGNLGLTNYGVFRYFDPSFIDWQKRLNLGEKFKQILP